MARQNSLLRATIARDLAVQKYCGKKKKERKENKLEKRKKQVSTALINSLEGKDRLLMSLYREGYLLDDIALRIGVPDRRWVGARKSEILKKWRNKGEY